MRIKITEHPFWMGVGILGVIVVVGMLGREAALPPINDPFQHTQKYCSVEKYGADKEDSQKTKEAFQKAFADCAPGGTVIIPRGIWQTGGIRIPSDVTMRFDNGSVLSFDDNPEKYLPAVATRFEGMDVMNYMPLLYADHVKNVAIIGRGKLIGNGGVWWKWRENRRNGQVNETGAAKKLYAMAKAGMPIEERVFASPALPLRPSFLQLYESNNVIIDGITLMDGPMWTLHPVYSKHVIIRNVTVDSTGPNTDGVAIDSSEDVLLENSHIGSDDDAIVMKSGLDDDGWRRNRPTRHVVVRNVTVNRGNAGVTIGSEMSGGVEDVTVENATFNGVDTGIRIKTLKGRGGFIRDIQYRNITMDKLDEDAVQITTKYKYGTLKSESDALPKLENISLENIAVKSASRAFRVESFKEDLIRNFTVVYSQFNVQKAGEINSLIGGKIDTVSITASDTEPLALVDVKETAITGPVSPTARMPVLQFRGSLTDGITIGLTPCALQACVRRGSDVPEDALHFSQ